MILFMKDIVRGFKSETSMKLLVPLVRLMSENGNEHLSMHVCMPLCLYLSVVSLIPRCRDLRYRFLCLFPPPLKLPVSLKQVKLMDIH